MSLADGRTLASGFGTEKQHFFFKLQKWEQWITLCNLLHTWLDIVQAATRAVITVLLAACTKRLIDPSISSNDSDKTGKLL